MLTTEAEKHEGRDQPLMSVALVVDDDPADARHVGDVFAAAGFKVLLASGPAEALALLQAGRRTDLVVSDVVMPGYDGPTLLQMLRAGGCTATFIAMTSDPTPAVRERCKAAGAAVCLHKPVNTELLVTTATQLLADGPRIDPNEDPLDAELLDVMRITYLQLLPQRAAAIRDTTDPTELAKVAHQLAGASAQFGYPGLAFLCRCLQRSARTGQLAPELIDAVLAAAAHATS